MSEPCGQCAHLNEVVKMLELELRLQDDHSRDARKRILRTEAENLRLREEIKRLRNNSGIDPFADGAVKR